jgi:alpha-methylacyl-CoA racemase
MSDAQMQGPLTGLTVIEFAGIGPGPFCGMLLADMGARVIRIHRNGAPTGLSEEIETKFDITLRGRENVVIDLKQAAGVEAALTLLRKADALIEGFRPGVMEQLGLGPEVCLNLNPRLVYGRMTGWGQSGPLAKRAGHDINYIALSGALNAIGHPEQPPVPPLNLVGDYGGGAILLAFGMACGLLEAVRSGHGQVVDAAMSDGAALMCAVFYSMNAQGKHDTRRGHNMLDGAAPYYCTYECADGRYISLGSLEPQFYARLIKLLALDPGEFEPQQDREQWPRRREQLAGIFRTKTRDQWNELLGPTDVCFAPVLDWDEAPRNPHNRARQTFVELNGLVQPAPSPRFSRTPGAIRCQPARHAEHTDQILLEFGYSNERILALRSASVIE